MKVRMLADISGTRDGADWPKRGEVADFPAEEAADLIAAGIAAKHDGKAPVESAAVDTEPAKRGPGRPRKAAESDED